MRCQPLLALVVSAAIVMPAAAAPLTVRVDSSGGAPRFLVNGKPTRSRIFWGAHGSMPIDITPKAQKLSLEFTAIASEPKTATIHLRFGTTPGDVFVDDFRMVDLDTNRDVVPLCDFEGGQADFDRSWTYWPTNELNTVGTVAVKPGVGRDGSSGLHVGFKEARGSIPDFHVYHKPNLELVKGHRYRIELWVRASATRNMNVRCYRPGNSFIFLGGPNDPFLPQIKLAAEAGVNLVSFPVGLPWPEPGQPVDWSGSDNQCEAVLAANPNALLIPRIGMEPPAWWRKQNPDAMMQWEDGPRDRGAVVASPKYRREAAERLAALITHLEEKYGDHIAGYHPCGQNTGEWFYQDTWMRTLNGYAPADLDAWRQWLKARYGSDAALQRAWRDPSARLDAAAVPTPAARHAAPAGTFRDPATERPLIDFVEFQQEMMADCVLELARAARQASRGRKLVVFFYGYVFEFSTVHTGPGSSGHYALRRVLQSPDIDVLCSPISYFDRGLSENAPSMTAAESVALAGKMWLHEDDTATYLSTGDAPGWRQRVKTLEDTNKQLVRNVAQAAVRNFGTWWMDLRAGGWFYDPGMWREMVRLNALDEPLLQNPIPYRPQVAAVVDERSMMRVAEGGNVVTRPGVYQARGPLGRMGAPYGQYLLDDVLAGRTDAKLYVFLSPWVLTAEERKTLLARTRGATRIWCYAPGYFEGDKISPEGMREVTGFRLEPVNPEQAWAIPTEAGKKLGLVQPFGVDKPVKPLFTARDAAPGEVLATYPDGSAAVALRRGPEGASLFVGVPGLTSELLRLAARVAGVHLFTQVDCNVYGSGPFLAVHASQDGPLTIDTGKATPVTDLLSGEVIGRGPKLTLPLKSGDSRVMRY